MFFELLNRKKVLVTLKNGDLWTVLGHAWIHHSTATESTVDVSHVTATIICFVCVPSPPLRLPPLF